MKKRLLNTIKSLKAQLSKGSIDPGTVEVMIGQTEAYIDFTEQYIEDLEVQEFQQVFSHRRTIANINEVLKDFGKIWKTRELN